MIYIVDIDSKKFQLNGIPYYKNFMPHVVGDNLRVVNNYDSRFELVGPNHFSKFNVNGQTFLNANALQLALLPVLFTRSNLGGAFIPDAILTQTGFTIAGNTFKLNAGWVWRIAGVIYTNTTEIELTIEFAADGKVRQDIVQLKVGGSVAIKKGIEVDEFPPKPVPDENCIEATNFPVNDNSVGEPSTPITGDAFVKKEDLGEVIFIGSGVTAMVLQAQVGGIRFQGTNLEFQSIFITDENNLWPGKPFKIKNTQLNTLTLKHLTGPGLKMLFPNAQDFILASNEIIEFEWHFNNANVWELQYVGKIQNVKRTHIINCTITGTFTANTSWWTASRESGSFLSPVFEATAQYNPITEVFLNARAAKHLVPFKSRIKRICWNYSTIATPLTINVHSFQGNSTIFNEKTVASKTFPTGSNNNTLEYLTGEMNITHVLEKNSYLTLCLFNNNISTGLVRPNIFQIELEEL